MDQTPPRSREARLDRSLEIPAESTVDTRQQPRRQAPSGLAEAINRAIARLLADQRVDGHWCYELEADCTIPAEYICYMHFMDERNQDLEARLARYLLDRQTDCGGWPLYHGGRMDLSCTVKAYFALKLTGHDPDSEPMRRARRSILEAGGAARANVFTRFLLAQFEQIPWHGVPYIPVEIVLLPGWFFFNIARVSYWSRTVMVPLFILFTLGVTAANPGGVDVRELFVTPPQRERDWFARQTFLQRLFLFLDRAGRRIDRWIPDVLRRRALRRAERWLVERLNGQDGLGAIFPAMINASEALHALGYPRDHPYRVQARNALRRLVVERGESAYCQPCVSPVWDTGLAALALLESGDSAARRCAQRGLEWLVDRQVTRAPGDWQRHRPDLAGGGWAFQYANDHYPDLDDTAVVAWTMHAHDPRRFRRAVCRARDWLVGMQSANGGFAAFDVDNNDEYLNQIPFADHGALLDPPTADVTARCLTLFEILGDAELAPVRERARTWLMNQQEAGGAWFGRWGTNYIYGTWSVLVALCARPGGRNTPEVARAADWLESVQRDDGGWGEGNHTYFEPAEAGKASCSRSFQTAWAVLGLVAAGRAESRAARHGVAWLIRHQDGDGAWREPWFNAPGFPRVFYLKYHGYSRVFPLWALASWRRAIEDAD